MARKKAVQRGRSVIIDDDPQPKRKSIVEEQAELVEETGDESPELLNLLEKFKGQDYEVRIWRLADDRTTWESIPGVPIEEFDDRVIVDTFGGGKYRFRIIAQDGTFVKQFTQSFARAVKKDAGLAVQPDKSSELMMKFLAEEARTAKEQANKNFEMMMAMLQNVGKKDSLDEILKYKSLFENKQSAHPVEHLKSLMEAISLLQEMREGQTMGSGDAVDRNIGKLLELIPNMLSGFGKKPGLNAKYPANTPVPATPVPVPVAPVDTPVPAPGPVPAQAPALEGEIVYDDEIERSIQGFLAEWKKVLLHFISIGVPAVKIASNINEQLDDANVILLSEYLKTKFDRVFTFHKELEPHREKFRAIADELIRLADEMKSETYPPREEKGTGPSN